MKTKTLKFNTKSFKLSDNPGIMFKFDGEHNVLLETIKRHNIEIKISMKFSDQYIYSADITKDCALDIKDSLIKFRDDYSKKLIGGFIDNRPVCKKCGEYGRFTTDPQSGICDDCC